MKYESAARPILTMEDLEAAQAAGARIEYTACGPGSGRGDNTYDMPRCDLPGSGGWIFPLHNPAFTVGPEWRETGRLLRAWYPLADDKEAAE